jgi:hypothetical protein
MSTSPFVTDQLHKHNTLAPATELTDPEDRLRVPTPEPKVWASVDLPSLNLSDPVGTTVRMPLIPKIKPNPALKNVEAVSIPKTSPVLHNTPMDSGLEGRMAQLRATSTTLRRDTDAVRRTTGTLK